MRLSEARDFRKRMEELAKQRAGGEEAGDDKDEEKPAGDFAHVSLKGGFRKKATDEFKHLRSKIKKKREGESVGQEQALVATAELERLNAINDEIEKLLEKRETQEDS